MKTIKKWLITLRNLIAELINYYISEPLCNYYNRKVRWVIHTTALALVTLAIAYLSAYNVLTHWFVKQQVITVAPWTYIRTAEAAEMRWPDIGDCEQYRPIVQKYFGKLTDEALFVASKESGCVADRISEKNKNGTRDFCLFQINQEKLAAQSLDVCVRRAFEKYTAGRVGEKNWSAFYAVCDVNAQPKYPKSIKNCS